MQGKDSDDWRLDDLSLDHAYDVHFNDTLFGISRV